MNEKKFSMTLAGKEINVSVGKYAGYTNGSCLVSSGESIVMVNTTMSKTPRPGMDFFPLSVDFEEKMYSVGKIPGGFKKREGKGSDKAILISRLIDRPIRPLFPKGFYNDVTVVATPLSVDNNFPTEILAMIGSSVALTISDIPFAGPTGSVLVGRINGEYVLNPSLEEQDKSDIHLTVSGTKDAIMMVEAGAHEVPEAEMLDAILFAHENIKKIVAFIEDIQKEVGKEKAEIEYYHVPEEIEKAVREFAYDKLVEALSPTPDKLTRQDMVDAVEAETFAHFEEIFEDSRREINDTLYALKKEIVRGMIFNHNIRPDGRTLSEVRPIWCEVGMLPRVHGSAVFTRGQTQVMNCLTLGTIGDAQKLEGLDDEEEKRYMHQYNMPGYATGEAKPLRAPGRREIGHGALAERALVPVIPSEEEFPYAIRLVSEVLSSNGSTSMASTCASTLALMDAGVPIKAPVAGVAMGLIKQDSEVRVLTDIQGIEDFYGDMDFKVTGTENGVTAIQMDIKIKGIDKEILTRALAQAKEGRMHILSKMLETIPAYRTEMSKYAPRIISFKIKPEKIREVIGSGGKTINKIIDETGVKIDITDDGVVMIASTDEASSAKAKQMIDDICFEPEVNGVYEGKVVTIMQFGAFVQLREGVDGMIHISKLSKERVEKVEDVVKVGDAVKVQCIKIDEKGRVDLKLIEKLS